MGCQRVPLLCKYVIFWGKKIQSLIPCREEGFIYFCKALVIPVCRGCRRAMDCPRLKFPAERWKQQGVVTAGRAGTQVRGCERTAEETSWAPVP